MNKIIYLLSILSFLFLFSPAHAYQSLSQKLSGRILLQIESHGEAWYINPIDQKKYFLGKPQDAFLFMKKFSIGITNSNLKKIPIGLINYQGLDTDNDGLSDDLENAIGTNINKPDSDNDGYSDKNEIEKNYNPLNKNQFNIDYNFINQNLGKIFLQIEKQGQAWYVNPADKKRYFLNRPSDAFLIMQKLGLGITNNNLRQIPIGYLNIINSNPTPTSTPVDISACEKADDPSQVFNAAADAFIKGKKEKATICFIPEMKVAVEYTINFLDADGRLTLANILYGSKLTTSTNTEKIYTNEVYFSLGGYKVPLKFIVKKQSDGKWLLTNL
jgi:hypothetical protein